MKKHDASIQAGEFSALEGFLAAYLHEDYHDEHATPEDALAEFLEDATPDEVQRLTHDWKTFRHRVQAMADAAQVNIFVHTLGSAWVPRHFADVEALFAKLSH